MGQGRFRTEEELVKDSVDLRPSGIRPVVTRHSASRERRGWDRAVASRGGLKLRRGGARRGGAGQLSEAGLCVDRPFRGGACEDLGSGRGGVRLGDYSRASDPFLRRLACPVLDLVTCALCSCAVGSAARLSSRALHQLSGSPAVSRFQCVSGVPLARGGLLVPFPLMRYLRDPCWKGLSIPF